MKDQTEEDVPDTNLQTPDAASGEVQGTPSARS